MKPLISKHVLLGVSGSVAAYKAAVLVRQLLEAGADVRVMMTQGATTFVTPMTFLALTGQPVHTELLDEQAEAAMGHIELARWADIIVIAPASADFIARLAQGRADDLVAAVCLASAAPKAVAPAMNQQMWLNPATQDNIATLAARQNSKILGPVAGEQACGDVGPGRMLEPEQILTDVEKMFASDALSGKTVLITAGPTREAIDPVRYIGNRSSGKMGFAIAQAAVEAGARVVMVSGPVSLDTPEKVNRIDVTSAAQMHKAVLGQIGDVDIFIACAAVVDYRPARIAEQKIKKSDESLTLELVRNPDILADVSQQFPEVFTIGFAAETESLEQNAKGKLEAKGLNMIAANLVDDGSVDSGTGFESNENALTVIWHDGQKELPRARKTVLASALIELIAGQMSR